MAYLPSDCPPIFIFAPDNHVNILRGFKLAVSTWAHDSRNVPLWGLLHSTNLLVLGNTHVLLTKLHLYRVHRGKMHHSNQYCWQKV
jgi:hypothetical protein